MLLSSMEKLLLLPYLAGAISLFTSLFIVIDQRHVSVPVSEIWTRFRGPLGVILIDKSLLTEDGFQLHRRLIRRIWWFVRFSVLGLLANLVHAAFTI
jgi:hypothetical protein